MNTEIKVCEIRYALAQAKSSLQIGRITKEKKAKMQGVLFAELHLESLIRHKEMQEQNSNNG